MILLFFFSLLLLNIADCIEKEIQMLLPQQEVIEHLEKINEGCGNDTWIVHTTDHRYIFRSPKTPIDPILFLKILNACKKTARSHLGPNLINYDVKHQTTLLEYIDSLPWPFYEEDERPYLETMHALSQFHSCLRTYPDKTFCRFFGLFWPNFDSFEGGNIDMGILPPSNESKFGSKEPKNRPKIFIGIGSKPKMIKETEGLPFSLLFTEAKSLKSHPELPDHFFLALETLENLYRQTYLQLKEKNTLCHGDFHKGNVLLKQNGEPLIIDLDSLEMGHPFFDVAKFTLGLKSEQRRALFCEYLGHREPSWEEEIQFELIDLSLLLLISTVRFKSAYETNADFLLKKEAAQALLNGADPLPSFLSIPFQDERPEMRQLGAIYALREFLERSASFKITK